MVHHEELYDVIDVPLGAKELGVRRSGSGSKFSSSAKTLYVHIQGAHMPMLIAVILFFPGSWPPPDLPLGRTGGRAGGDFTSLCFLKLLELFFGGLQALGGIQFF